MKDKDSQSASEFLCHWCPLQSLPGFMSCECDTDSNIRKQSPLQMAPGSSDWRSDFQLLFPFNCVLFLLEQSEGLRAEFLILILLLGSAC